MSALDQKQTLDYRQPMSALPPIANIAEQSQDVRFVPIADIVPLKTFRAEIGWAGAKSVKRLATVARLLLVP